MPYDLPRLFQAFRDARAALGIKQEELAQRAGVNVQTIKNLEGAREFRRWPKSVSLVEAALGKGPGWALGIAIGAAPVPAERLTGNQNLPAAVRMALEDGETLGADVIDLSRPGSKFRIIVVGKLDEYDSDESRDRLREEMEEWIRINGRIRQVVSEREDKNEQDNE